MFKKILLSAAALSGLFLFASLRLLQATLSLLLVPQAALLHRDPSRHDPRVERLLLRVHLPHRLSRHQDLQLADPGSPVAPHRLGKLGLPP